MVNGDQNKAPIFDALKKYVDNEVIQFHVPGHKQGKGIIEFREYVGDRILKMDACAMECLDFATNPTSVILEAETLMAQAFGAQNALFLVNGTTSGIQTMVMSVCTPGNEIIVPRNAHKSIVGALILSGAIPIYILPEINKNLGVAMGIEKDTIIQAINNHKNAKALFIINPTYYGVTSDLQFIVDIAHNNNIAVLADEAHGSHMYFHNDFPLTAMDAGADMSAASIHKTSGSMTQSSILLTNNNMISIDRIKQVLNLTKTTSSSYILMSSLDVARKQLAIHGKELLEQTLQLARYARSEINNIPGFYAFGKDLVKTLGCFNFDETKLSINVMNLGRTGFEIHKILRKEYNIEVELSDLYNIMAIITIGDSKYNIDILINALKDISLRFKNDKIINIIIPPFTSEVVISPRDAFFSAKKFVPLEDAIGKIAGEMVMAYPPGIPIIGMGERITKDIIEYIKLLKCKKCHLEGMLDTSVNYLQVITKY